MISAMHTALSGLSGFAKTVEVAAHDIANVNTDGFKKSHVEFVEVQSGGILPVVQKDNSQGPTILRDMGYGPAPVELSNVDLAEEAINLIIGQRGVQANLRTLDTANAVLGSILDIKR